jgi:hypothetical protein
MVALSGSHLFDDIRMEFDRGHVLTVDWGQVLRASRHGDDAVHLGPQHDVIAARATGARHSIVQSATRGMFIQTLNGCGTSDTVRPIAIIAMRRLSEQFS